MVKNQENKQQPAIVINTQYIKDLSLEIPHAPEIFKNIGVAPALRVDVDIESKHLEDRAYNVSLHFHIEGKIEDRVLFLLELVYAGVVSLNIPKEHLEPVLMIEIPRLFFPFARSVITNCLSEGGLPPFMLNPIDFAAMYQAKQAAKQAN